MIPEPSREQYALMRKAWPCILKMRKEQMGMRGRGLTVIKPERIAHVPLSDLTPEKLMRRGLDEDQAREAMTQIEAYWLGDHAPFLLLCPPLPPCFHLWRSFGD